MGFFSKKKPPQQQQAPVPNPLQPSIPSPKKGPKRQQPPPPQQQQQLPEPALIPPPNKGPKRQLPPPPQQQQQLPLPVVAQPSRSRVEQIAPPQQRQVSSREVRLDPSANLSANPSANPSAPPKNEVKVAPLPVLSQPELKTPPPDVVEPKASREAELARHSELEDEAQRNVVTRELVKKFVADIWNKGDLEFIPQVCGKGLRFNGSVGMDRVGHDGFARMVTTIREALDDYHCEIHSMVVEGGKAFCRMRFTGRHAGPLLGHPPTGRHVAWMGAAEFTCKDGKIVKVWELGDVKSLEDQLSGT